MRRRILPCAVLSALLVASPAGPTPAIAADNVVVFAAASLKNALDDVADAYKAETGRAVTVNYAASSALARQIEAGAPADIFFSADLDWMDYLQTRNLIDPATRKTLLGNRLVIVAPRDSAARIDIAAGMDLAGLLGADGRIAMANVDSVPAGKYAKAALTRLGVWDRVSARVVQADNVRAALAFVARGEAPLGIVYRSDAMAEPGVRVLGVFPEESHPPIVYPVALTAGARNADAGAFLRYLESDKARPLYEKQGFTFVGAGS